MASYHYHLLIRHEFNVPLTEREQGLVEAFAEKYKAIVTGDESKRRFMLQFSSEQPLKIGELEKELTGLKIIDFHEVE